MEETLILGWVVDCVVDSVVGSVVDSKGEVVDSKGDVVDSKGSVVESKGDVVDNKGEVVESVESNVVELLAGGVDSGVECDEDELRCGIVVPEGTDELVVRVDEFSVAVVDICCPEEGDDEFVIMDELSVGVVAICDGVVESIEFEVVVVGVNEFVDIIVEPVYVVVGIAMVDVGVVECTVDDVVLALVELTSWGEPWMNHVVAGSEVKYNQYYFSTLMHTILFYYTSNNLRVDT